MRLRRTAVISMLLLISVAMAVATLYIQWLGQERQETSLSRVRVAIYVGPRVWRDGLQALEAYLESRNISYSLVDSNAIKRGMLNSYDILVVPGGWAYSYRLDLGLDGNKAIRRFVEEGGGYLGICAGGFYASRIIMWEAKIYHYSLGILDAVAQGPKQGYPWPTYARLSINVTEAGLALGLNKTYTAVYYGGPEFRDLGRGIQVIAVYGDDGMPAIIAGTFGKGRVAATGVHLEVREDTWPVLDALLRILAGG